MFTRTGDVRCYNNMKQERCICSCKKESWVRVRRGNVLQSLLCQTCAMVLRRKSQPGDTHRTCNTCNESKLVSEMGTGSNKNKCKECRKNQRKVIADAYALQLNENPPDGFRDCSICKQNKHESKFMIHIDHRTKCKECHAKSVSGWRKDNSEANAEIAKRAYDKTYGYVFELKKNNPCEICKKFFHPCQMDYDHLDRSTKRAQMSKLYSNGIKAVKTEIAKCRLICANCHRDETKKTEHLTPLVTTFKPKLKIESGFVDEPLLPGQPSKVCTGLCGLTKPLSSFDNIGRGYKQSYCKKCMFTYRKSWRATNQTSLSISDRNRRLEVSNAVNSTKDNKTCDDCNQSFRFWQMDYDHLPNSEKRDNVSVLKSTIKSVNKVMEELAKCDLVCANCHRLRTHNRQQAMAIYTD